MPKTSPRVAQTLVGRALFLVLGLLLWTGCGGCGDVEADDRGLVGTPGRGAVARLSRTIENSVGLTSGVDATHGAIGHAFLASGRLSEAVETLGVALLKQPDPAVANDLAAAHIERFREDHRPEDLLEALRILNDLDSGDGEENAQASEILFNRALALSLVPLPSLATEAWHSYLAQHHEDSGEVELVADHLDRLSSYIQERVSGSSSDGLFFSDPQSERVEATFVTFAEWGRSILAGNRVDADRLFEKLHTVGLRLAQNHDSPQLLDALEHVKALGKSQLGDVAEGVVALGDGYWAYRERNFDLSRRRFETAIVNLGRARSPLLTRARFQLSIVDYYSGPVRAERDLVALLAEVSERHDAALEGEILWMLGLCAAVRESPSESIEHYERARPLISKCCGDGRAASIDLNLAEARQDIGEWTRAWTYRLAAHQARGIEPSKRQVILLDAAITLYESGDLQLARLWLEEAKRNALILGRPEAWVEIYRTESRVAAEARDSTDALRLVAMAEQSLSEMPSNEGLERLRQTVAMTKAMAMAKDYPEMALEGLDSSWDWLSASGYRLDRLRWLRASAQAYVASGRHEKAIGRLRDALDLLERMRIEAPRGRDRFASFDQAQRVVDELLTLGISQGWTAAESLGISERARARGTLEGSAEVLPAGEAAVPLTASEIVDSMPGEAALLSFRVIGDRVARWTVSEGSIDFAWLHASTIDLQRRTGELSWALVHGDQSRPIESLLSSLSADLLEGLAIRDGTTQIIVVPDRFLSSVPFAVLPSPESGGRLVDHYPIVVSPSASLALRRAAAGAPLKRTPSLLLVRPEPSSPRYPALVSARGELQSIVDLGLGSVSRLEGSGATAKRLLESAGQHTVLHFAGHAVLGDGPWSAALIMAPDADGNEFLALEQLVEARLSAQAQLVVLAACETAGVSSESREALFGVASGFLAAGVPMVVGTLWSVDDASSRELVVDFYRELGRGLPPAKALQLAQRAALVGFPENTRTWSAAAFTALGSAQARALFQGTEETQGETRDRVRPTQ